MPPQLTQLLRLMEKRWLKIIMNQTVHILMLRHCAVHRELPHRKINQSTTLVITMIWQFSTFTI